MSSWESYKSALLRMTPSEFDPRNVAATNKSFSIFYGSKQASSVVPVSDKQEEGGLGVVRCNERSVGKVVSSPCTCRSTGIPLK